MELYVNAKELLATANLAYNKNNAWQTRLCGVLVEADEIGSYTLRATDSYKLIEFNSTAADTVATAGRCVIPIATVKDNVKTSDSVFYIAKEDDSDTITMRAYKGTGAKRTLRCSFECKHVAEAEDMLMGSAKKILDDWGKDAEKDCTCVHLDATLLADVCKAITTAYGKDKAIDVAFSGAHKPIFVHARRDMQNYCRAVLMPMHR